MILDLDRARQDAERAVRRSGMSLDQRRDIYARMHAGDADDGGVGALTLSEQGAYYSSLMIYTGGMGAVGAGTMPEDLPKCRAMEAEYQRVFWGQDPA